MPLAILKSIREVSSEDEVHAAKNLLQEQSGKKWRTKNVGEKSAYIIIEMVNPHCITGIDIGNEHSAYIEVLVGRAGCAADDFTEILITSSFMTPMESKSSNNPNRVRCFNKEALVSTALNNKWQMIKVICTQPFNKHVQYGLSFIKVHVAETKESETSVLPKQLSTDLNDTGGGKLSTKPTKLAGKFVLREDSPDSDSESTNILFKRWKTTRSSEVGNSLSTAAAIRNASTPAGLRQLSDCYTKSKSSAVATTSENDKDDKGITVLDRNRQDLLFGDKDESQSDENRKKRLQDGINADRDRLRQETEKAKVAQKKETQKSANLSSSEASTSKPKRNSEERTKNSPTRNEVKEANRKDSDRGRKRHSSPNSNTAKKIKFSANSQQKYRPFDKLFQGVVLAISGIPNPDRADLRKKALAMGSKYKADWDDDCTHLICAFKNTPKYNQVKGIGKIVTRGWVEQCYDEKKYLPWRRFALDNTELSKAESDEEIFDESLKSASGKKPSSSSPSISNPAGNLENVDKSETLRKVHNISSDSDTDDEIQRVLEVTQNKSQNNKENKILGENKTIGREKDGIEVICNKTGSEQEVYDLSTDEEDYLKEKLILIKKAEQKAFN